MTISIRTWTPLKVLVVFSWLMIFAAVLPSTYGGEEVEALGIRMGDTWFLECNVTLDSQGRLIIMDWCAEDTLSGKARLCDWRLLF